MQHHDSVPVLGSSGSQPTLWTTPMAATMLGPQHQVPAGPSPFARPTVFDVVPEHRWASPSPGGCASSMSSLTLMPEAWSYVSRPPLFAGGLRRPAPAALDVPVAGSVAFGSYTAVRSGEAPFLTLQQHPVTPGAASSRAPARSTSPLPRCSYVRRPMGTAAPAQQQTAAELRRLSLLSACQRALEAWDSSEHSRRAVREAFEGVEAQARSLGRSAWTIGEVRRFGHQLLVAHGVDPVPWPDARWQGLLCSLPSGPAGQNTLDFRVAEQLARKIFESLCLELEARGGGSIVAPAVGLQATAVRLSSSAVAPIGSLVAPAPTSAMLRASSAGSLTAPTVVAVSRQAASARRLSRPASRSSSPLRRDGEMRFGGGLSVVVTPPQPSAAQVLLQEQVVTSYGISASVMTPPSAYAPLYGGSTSGSSYAVVARRDLPPDRIRSASGGPRRQSSTSRGNSASASPRISISAAGGQTPPVTYSYLATKQAPFSGQAAATGFLSAGGSTASTGAGGSATASSSVLVVRDDTSVRERRASTSTERLGLGQRLGTTALRRSTLAVPQEVRSTSSQPGAAASRHAHPGVTLVAPTRAASLSVERSSARSAEVLVARSAAPRAHSAGARVLPQQSLGSTPPKYQRRQAAESLVLTASPPTIAPSASGSTPVMAHAAGVVTPAGSCGELDDEIRQLHADLAAERAERQAMQERVRAMLQKSRTGGGSQTAEPGSGVNATNGHHYVTSIAHEEDPTLSSPPHRSVTFARDTESADHGKGLFVLEANGRRLNGTPCLGAQADSSPTTMVPDTGIHDEEGGSGQSPDGSLLIVPLPPERRLEDGVADQTAAEDSFLLAAAATGHDTSCASDNSPLKQAVLQQGQGGVDGDLTHVLAFYKRKCLELATQVQERDAEVFRLRGFLDEARSLQLGMLDAGTPQTPDAPMLGLEAMAKTPAEEVNRVSPVTLYADRTDIF
eukprot:TRINITY_DN82308_c0_g1_i1.p1 TRINITY_DN82308_c0_g1~~TRINITY_DN82308_c0_g1_i1.p1  ORF type:complete len:961 (+),score=191.26 TRINITY_DN82308_c0_g1_i1:69-2951(+)